MKYSVYFIQSYPYEIEAENEEEALSLALEEFEDEMRSPIVRTDYDDVEIIENEEE